MSTATSCTLPRPGQDNLSANSRRSGRFICSRCGAVILGPRTALVVTVGALQTRHPIILTCGDCSTQLENWLDVGQLPLPALERDLTPQPAGATGA